MIKEQILKEPSILREIDASVTRTNQTLYDQVPGTISYDRIRCDELGCMINTTENFTMYKEVTQHINKSGLEI